MKKTAGFFSLTISLIIITNCLDAQFITLNFFSLDREQGLSHNNVTCVVADKEGYMWFGTDRGLNRYDGYGFTRFYAGEEAGSLPENKIVNLLVSSRGDLWVGLSTKGICRYYSPGREFIRYRLGSNPYSGSAGEVRDIAEDRDSILYVASAGGLFYLLPGSGEFDSIPVPGDDNDDNKPDGLLSRYISSIAADSDHGLWIAYDDWRLTYYNNRDNTFRHFSLQEFQREDQQTLISSMIQKDGKLWIGSQGPGFMVFDPENNEYEVLLRDQFLVIVGQIAPSSRQELLWLATGSGLVSYNTFNGDFRRFTYVRSDIRSMTSTAIGSVCEDDKGVIWVGTYNGGDNYAFIDKPFRHIDIGLDQYYALAEENVTAIIQDNIGNLWVGFSSGLVEYHVNEQFKKYSIPIHSLFGEWGPGTIFDLFQDSRGDIYCASWQGGLQKFDRASMRFKPVTGSREKYFELFDASDIRDIEEDREGRLWLAVHGKGIYVFDKDEKSLVKYVTDENDSATISNDWVYDVCFDDHGYAWVGSAWGVSRISLQDNSVVRYANYVETDSNLTANSTPLVTLDDLGNIWVGTDNGLNLYDRATDKFHLFGKSSLLPVLHIRALEQDTSGSYWASTTEGILKFDLDYDTEGKPFITNQIHYDKEDGLQTNNFAISCSSEDGNSWLFFGGTQGMDFFDPSAIRPVTIKPELRIKEFEVYGKAVFPGTEGGPAVNKDGVIELDYKQDMVGFEYVALNYFNVNGNSYSYRLEPLQAEWIDAGNRRNIAFSNLDPGHYKLSLRVTTEDGIENIHEGITEFHIRPPFWQTTVFRIAAILFVLGITYLVFRLYTAGLRRKKVQLEATVRKRTGELQEKNLELEQQSAHLKEVNTLLEKRQEKIQEQSEELMQQSESLALANKDLNELNAMKDKFFSIIAHDLKNPFNTILGFADLLIQDYDSYTDDKRRELLGHVHKSVAGAYSLLENLLHWSRSQTERLKIKARELLARDIMETNYGLINPMLKSKNIRFSYTCDKDLTVWADWELINTVLRNLLSNAIKFTPEGGEITVSVKPAGKKQLQFEVRDTGIGMDREEVDSIFRIDVVKKKQGTAGEEGTGLGMILCKEFVEKMGGRIWVESSTGKGTSVYFTLPSEAVAVKT